MTASYRYLFYDIMSQTPTIELPLYGTNFTRQLNRMGNGTFSQKLDVEGLSNADIIDGTMPGRTEMYVERNKRLIWGGIVWSRTWQEQSKSLQFSSQTFESWLFSQAIEEALAYTDEDQRNIVRELITHMQAKSIYSDIGIVVPDAFSDNVVRTVDFSTYEGWTYGRAIDYMSEYDEGLDWTIEVAWGDDNKPTKRLRVNDVLGRSLSDTSLVFDYPGNIKNFWWPESAAKGAVTVLGRGKGEGSEAIHSKYTHSDLLALGYPDIQRFYDNKDTSVQATLDSQTKAEADLLKVPAVVPTFELASAEILWNLGDYANFIIKSPRFPKEPNRFSSRIIGWELTPLRSDTSEELKLIIPGQGIE